MSSMTVADAHRDADCALVHAQWWRQLLLTQGEDVAPADAAIVAANQRITDLTALEAPPGDLDVSRDAFMQPQRDGIVDDIARLDTVVNDPATGAVLYPDDDPVEAADMLAVQNDMLSSLDFVWSP